MNEHKVYSQQFHLTQVTPDLIERCREQVTTSPYRLAINQNTSILRKMRQLAVQLIRPTDSFFWPSALLIQALMTSFEERKDQQDLKIVSEYFDRWLSKGPDLLVLDHAMNGYSLLALMSVKGPSKYERALETVINFLTNHPTDSNGSLPYRAGGKEILIDSLGMICPFLARYAHYKGRDDLMFISTNQFVQFIQHGFDQKSFLPYHAYNFEDKKKLGIIGWGRGVGWILSGLVDTLQYLPASHETYSLLRSTFVKLVETVLQYQTKSGCFTWQLEAIDGPIDTSSTSMIGYSIVRGIQLGYLGQQYESCLNAIVAGVNNYIINGQVTQSSAECRGLGMYPQTYSENAWGQAFTTSMYILSSRGGN